MSGVSGRNRDEAAECDSRKSLKRRSPSIVGHLSFLLSYGKAQTNPDSPSVQVNTRKPSTQTLEINASIFPRGTNIQSEMADGQHKLMIVFLARHKKTGECSV